MPQLQSLTATADWRALFGAWSALIAAGDPGRMGELQQASLERLLGATGQVANGLRAAQVAMRHDSAGSFHVAYYLMAVRGVEALEPPCWVVSPQDPTPPQVSLVLPVHNQWPLTLNCLRSLMVARNTIRCEVLLADDASTDATAQIAAANPWLRAATTASNVGFLENCNQAAALARGDVLVFLNNDTLVGDHWLDQLWSTLEACPGTGIVGSQVYAAEGSVLESGGICWADGEVWNHGRGYGPERQFLLNHRREVDYVSGCALAIRRDLWSRLEGFDPIYRPAYAEDTDLCLRARQAGMAVMVQPWSRIVHLEGLSHSRRLNEGQKRHQRRNLDTFRQRWRQLLLAEQLQDTRQWLLASDRGLRRGPVALLLLPTLPSADGDQASRSGFGLIQTFQALGFKLVVLPEREPALAVERHQLEQAGVLCLPAAPDRQHGWPWLQQQLPRLDVLLCAAAGGVEAAQRLNLLSELYPQAFRIGFGAGEALAAMDGVLSQQPRPDELRELLPAAIQPQPLRTPLHELSGAVAEGLGLLASSRGLHSDRWLDRDNALLLELGGAASRLQLELYLPDGAALKGELLLDTRLGSGDGMDAAAQHRLVPGLNQLQLPLAAEQPPGSLLMLTLQGAFERAAASATDQRRLLAVLVKLKPL